MAKFFYKMQNILNIKYKLEEQAKSAYGAAKAILDEEEELLEEKKAKKEAYEQTLRNMVLEQLNILEIKRMEDAVEVSKYHIKMQMIAVRNAKKQVEIARKKLNEAMIERKTHEKLKENAFEVFKEEIKMEEKKEVDELVSFKYSRPMNSEE